MNDAVRRARAEWPDEELETGEPLPDEPAPAPRKIRAGGFTGRGPGLPPVPDAPDAPRREQPAPPAGQMVLTTAKYLPPEPSMTQRAEQARAEGDKKPAKGMWTGLLMMVGAVAWFAIGLMDDTIYFYPPLLFVAGLLTFLKGDKGE